jgi:oxygen-independent coproporphyrinogen-3 oxidase
MYGKLYTDISIDSIFYGGGTPSMLTDEQIYRIQNVIYKNFDIADNCETTIESNPEDFITTPERFINLRNMNINRISFGIQSFDNKALKFLTRMHTAEEAEAVILQAKKYFSNISLDMIYAIPYETKDELKAGFEKVVSLDIPHISAYSLIFEKYTRLNMLSEQNKIIRKSNDEEAEEYFLINDILCNNGFTQYEVSNYSQKNFESIHNRKYWNYNDYIGFGPSAHSYVSRERWNNYRNIIKYNNALEKNTFPIEKKEKLTTDEMTEEFIFLGLRSEGINFEKYNFLFGENFEIKYKKKISLLIESGFGEIKNGRFELNNKGKIIADEIQLRYFSEPD